jgi:hypothetical protein
VLVSGAKTGAIMTARTNGGGAVQIGWASRDITPSQPVVLRGQFYVRISEGASDRITVTALAIESAGGGQAIIVSCDLVGVSADEQDRVRKALAGRLDGFDTRMLFMHATHTHTAPTLSEGAYPPQDPPVMSPAAYADLFVAKVAEAAEEAWTNRRPAGVSWAHGHAVVGFNRRAVHLDGSAKMYGKTNVPEFANIEGYEDHGLHLLFTWDPEGKLTGLVINIACPSQVSEHERCVSADYWHETRQELRKRFGEALFILSQCAPAGDQSPHPILRKEMETAMLKRRGVTERQEIARRIVSGVDEVLQVSKADIRTELPLAHHVEMLDLPARKVTAEEYEQAKAEIAKLEADREMEASRRFVHTRRNRNVAKRYGTQGDAPVQPIELHVLRIGDVAMATDPFELFLDFGIRIQARSKALQTLNVQLACNYNGYLPTQRAIEGRSYGAEVASNLVGPEGGQALVNRTIELIDELWS